MCGRIRQAGDGEQYMETLQWNPRTLVATKDGNDMFDLVISRIPGLICKDRLPGLL